MIILSQITQNQQGEPQANLNGKNQRLMFLGKYFSMTPKYTYLPFICLLLATLLFSGCSKVKTIGSATAEDTAVQAIREIKMGNFEIDIKTIQTVQSVELADGVLVLLQYGGFRMGGGAETCEYVMEIDKSKSLTWEVHSGSGLCHEINDPTDTQPITVGTSQSSNFPKDFGYTAAYGNIRDPKITKIVISWEDGQIQQANIQDATYIAAQKGDIDLDKIEAFDENGKMIYTTR